MTKREFDAATRERWGKWGGPRTAYRALRRGGAVVGDDMIARRSQWVSYMRREVSPGLATLGVGSKWRSVASWRAGTGRSLLETGRA